MKFLDAIFENNAALYNKIIDDEITSTQFKLYIKFDKDKLLNFMQKLDFQMLPLDGDTLCE